MPAPVPSPQLSPRFQVLVAAAYLAPNFLVGLRAQRHLHQQRQLAWRAAAVLAVGHAACGLVVSAGTDLAGRAAFVQELRRRGAAAGQGQRQGNEDSSGNESDGGSAYGEKSGKAE